MSGVGTSNAAQQVEAIKAQLPQLQTVLLAETNLFRAKAAVSADFVASKALGGGWEITFPSDRTPPLSLAKVGIPVSGVVHVPVGRALG